MITFNKEIDNESKLRQANEDLSKLLLEFKDYAIFITDISGNIVTWSEGAENIYGYSTKEVTGKHISIFYTPDEIQARLPWKILTKALENGRYEHEELKYRKNGTPFFANTVLNVLHYSDNSIRGFAKITRDITKQKKLEEENKVLTEQLEEKVRQRTKELEIVNKELEAFSYSVSHDLRVPLRAISGFSNMLQEDYEDKLDKEGNRIIDVIVEKTKMMGQLIDDLLTFSKMARLEVVNEGIDMEYLAKKCIDDFLQNGKEVRYSVIINKMPSCRGDVSMLKQVWSNLLANAVKYSSKKEQPQIEIGAEESTDNITYYVRDNGTGFDMQYADKLFGVFQRLHRQDEFEGTGLGLALVKRIISKHGGEIWAEAALNKGATFYFSIPKKTKDAE
jgi:PAS domain S-box-containing protein